jgi:hypothetical protein
VRSVEASRNSTEGRIQTRDFALFGSTRSPVDASGMDGLFRSALNMHYVSFNVTLKLRFKFYRDVRNHA